MPLLVRRISWLYHFKPVCSKVFEDTLKTITLDKVDKNNDEAQECKNRQIKFCLCLVMRFFVEFANFFKYRICAFAHVGVFSVKINLPTLNHVVNRLQERKEALAQDVDCVDKGRHDIQALVSIIETMVSLFPSPLRSTLAHYKHGDKECICHKVLDNVPISHGEPLDCLDNSYHTETKCKWKKICVHVCCVLSILFQKI